MAGADVPPADRFLNRELSWLEFNRRVLAQAERPDVPVLEQVKFVAIFGQNLDEFVQVRVAGLKDQVAAGIGARSPDGLTAAQQLHAVQDAIEEQVSRAEHLFLDRICPALASVGIIFSSYDDLGDEDRKELDKIFHDRIFPVLTPLAIDPGHPFPYISHLSLNLAVIVRDPVTALRRFARVKVPPSLPRFLVLPDGERFVPLEQVIAAHLEELFPGMNIEAQHAFRVTRNADLTLEEDEAEDLLAMVEMELRRRRFRRAVRLELDANITSEVRDLLVRELDLNEGDVEVRAGPLDLGGLHGVANLDRPDLKYPAYTPVTPAVLTRDDRDKLQFFKTIRRQDVLLHHPYDSFAATVEDFVAAASRDPKVLAIKLALYRTSGDSPIVRSLIRAAERGKQVAALVELKARGDEQANIEWARALEEAGVHVVYGLVGLKTHTKICLVVRDEPEGIRRYCHIGTGNYNGRTARYYEDLGLLTADPEIGADLTDLFNYLTGYGRNLKYRRLLVAPHALRARVKEFILAEARANEVTPGSGRIRAKMNNLVDPDMIDALYAASRAGVSIDLVVRGICCLRPGVKGLSENIRIRSIIGRYLEHSRIFEFANGNGEAQLAVYFGSADWMPRNLDKRIEALTPVTDPELVSRLCDILDVNLADDSLAWELGADANWRPVNGPGECNTHLRLQQLALQRGS